VECFGSGPGKVMWVQIFKTTCVIKFSGEASVWNVLDPDLAN
jgi:hypothetical protein